MKTQIIEDAKVTASAEAQKVTEAAQVSIEQARRESEKQLKEEVSELALQIAEKILRKNMSNDTAQKELVNRLLNEVETKN